MDDELIAPGLFKSELISDAGSGLVNGKPFGEDHARERLSIRATLIAKGLMPGTPELHFAVVKEQERRAASRLTFRQRQDLARWLGLKWAGGAGVGQAVIGLTDEEARYLRERLAGANDPLGQAILAKIGRKE